MTNKKIRIGILTASDRASKGVYEDLSGQAIRVTLNSYLSSAWEEVYAVLPDSKEKIERELKNMIDKKKCCLVITTGGTGPAPRDVTPDATESVCSKMLPGFGEIMRAASLRYVPTSILSRQTAGIRKKSLVVNLPGRPKAVKECLEAVFPAIPDCLQQIGGPLLECNPETIKVYRT
jgi:molybdopterin adenylyltransferase